MAKTRLVTVQRRNVRLKNSKCRHLQFIWSEVPCHHQADWMMGKVLRTLYNNLCCESQLKWKSNVVSKINPLIVSSTITGTQLFAGKWKFEQLLIFITTGAQIKHYMWDLSVFYFDCIYNFRHQLNKMQRLKSLRYNNKMCKRNLYIAKKWRKCCEHYIVCSIMIIFWACNIIK